MKYPNVLMLANHPKSFKQNTSTYGQKLKIEYVITYKGFPGVSW